MKYLKKTLSFVLAFAMAFTMVIVPKGSVSAAGDDDTSTTNDSSTAYTYFDTTMFNYDTDTFNAATANIIPTKQQLNIVSSVPDTQMDALIVSNGYALKDDGNNNLTAVKFDDIKNSDSIDSSLLWTLSNSSSSRTIKNKQTNNYLNISSDSVSLSEEDTNLYVNSNDIYYSTWNGWNSRKNYLNYDTTSEQFKVATSATNSLKIYTYQGIYFNDGGETTTISGTSVTNENYNKWTGKWDADGVNGIVQDTDKLYACTGIVQPQLDKNGKIVFNYPEAGIFDTSKSTGKSTYTNVEMPFKKDADGYYYYDSEEYDVKFPDNTPASNVKLEDEGKTTIEHGGSYKTAFLPFSSSTNNIDSSPKFHFGMNMSVKFYMTQDGKITTVDKDGNEQKTDMTFEFSGDDDVWVFVDDKLVLDIGGIHDAISADINFATGSAKVYKGTESTVARETKLFDTDSTSGIFDTDAATWRGDTDKPHTLQVFYLERGKGLSNCKIKFNLPQQDTLDVTKSLGNDINSTTDLKDEDLKALLNQSFKFRISSCTDNSTYAAYANKKYTIYEDGSNIGSGVTNSNGEFTLKFNQTASFAGEKTSGNVTNLGIDGYFKVEEIKDSNSKYTTKWTTSKTVKGTITDASMGANDTSTEAVLKVDGKTASDESSKYHFTFINTLEPTLNDDVVVLDYGKQVKIDVLANDVLFASERKIAGINTENCHNGKLTLSDNNTTLTYRPYKYMESVDKATYTVNTDKDGLGASATANVSIMPATTVYYEDNFGGSGQDGEDGLAITYTGKWYTVDDNGKQTELDKTSGNTNTDYQDDGTVGNGNQYGYDSSYDGDGKFSNGSSAIVEGTYADGEYKATASFKFKGTGFDIISRTDSTCGTIHVVVTDENGYLVLQDEDGEYYVSDILASERPRKDTIAVVNQGTNDLYQIPVITCKGLDHGKYNVLIKVAGPAPSMELGSTFYLDAIRIYEPIKTDNGNDSDNEGTTEGEDSNNEGSTGSEDSNDESSEDINVPGQEGAVDIDPDVLEAYAKDNELDTKTTKIKDIILTDDGHINTQAFIDTVTKGTSGSTSDKETYDNLGPNNEVYLSEGQGITFKINADDQIPTKVYIGAKSPNAKESTLSVSSVGSSAKSDTVIKSATDMYYDVTNCVKFTKEENGNYTATIVIGNKNTSSEDATKLSLLSLTNIKLAYSDKAPISENSLYSVPEDNTKSVKLANKLLARKQEVKQEETTKPKEANLEITNANFTSSKVSILKSGTLVVKTSADVKYLGILDSKGKVIQPSSITSKTDKSLVGTDKDSVAKTWTVKIKFNKLGNQKIAVYGIGEDGSASKNIKEVSVKVTLLGSIKDLFTEW